MANFHAEKSGHDQFEESTEEVRTNDLFPYAAKLMRSPQVKPLTEEEKKHKLEELRAKVAPCIFILSHGISYIW